MPLVDIDAKLGFKREMQPIHVVVPGEICPWKRAQRRRFANGGVTTFTDPKVEAYHGVVRMAAAAAMAGRPPIEDPVLLSVLAVFPIPKSWSGKRQREALAELRHKTTRPDLENSIKGCLDAMQSVVYRDDAQIVGYFACCKIYGDRPRLEIWVEPVPHGEYLALVFPSSEWDAAPVTQVTRP